MNGTARGITLAAALSPLAALALSCGDVRSELIVGAVGAALCAGDAECPGDRAHCDLEAQRCVQCAERSHCAAGQSCALPAGVCVQSCSPSSCPPSAPVCDASSGLCEPCNRDDQCGAGRYCDGASGRCIECRQAGDCRDPELPFCDLGTGRCVECTQDGHCEEDDEQCSLALGECAVRCQEEGEGDDEGEEGCPDDDPICDLSSGFCVECRVDADCGQGFICRASECRRSP